MLEWIIKQVVFLIFFAIASIGSLCAIRFPLTIFRSIWPIIIKAIDRKPVRTFAHVFKKVLKRIQPAVADVDATPSVISEVILLRVIATVFHAFPDSVGPGSFANAVSMRNSLSSINLAFQATARLGMSALKVMANNKNFLTTNTSTDPSDSSIFMIWPESNDGQSTKLCAN